MARQFLTGLAPEMLAAHPHLQTLSEIISSTAKYPRVRAVFEADSAKDGYRLYRPFTSK